MRHSVPSVLATVTLLLGGAPDLEAQVVQELLDHWGGRVRTSTETVYDPADTRRNRAGNSPTRDEQFWVFSIRDTGGQMEGWQRFTDWDQKNIIMTSRAYGYPLAVTEIDGNEFKVEWSQGLLSCVADVELKDEASKLEGRFVCRRRSTSRTVLETVTRGRIDFERYRPEGSGPPPYQDVGARNHRESR